MPGPRPHPCQAHPRDCHGHALSGALAPLVVCGVGVASLLAGVEERCAVRVPRLRTCQGRQRDGLFTAAGSLRSGRGGRALRCAWAFKGLPAAASSSFFFQAPRLTQLLFDTTFYE